MVGGVFLPGEHTLDVIPLSVGIYRYASITPITGTDWSVVVLSNHLGAFGGIRYMPLIIVAIAMLIISMVVGSLLVHNALLSPLLKLVKSTRASVDPETIKDIHGLTRNDEIGELATAIQFMRDGLRIASRAKSDFLFTMSHEMRTPLNAIIGMAEIAKSAETSERKIDAMNKIEKAATHLLGIINDILDMGKIEANKLELQNVNFDLRKLLQNVTTLIEFPMEEKRHNFSVKLNENVPFFYFGDNQRLAQVLTNLLSNAIIYTPAEGEICLEVSVLATEGEMCELHFVVADNGIGIAKEDHKRLFDMFEQLNSNMNRKFGGTGVGLAITKRLLALMHGDITVESELGKGSRFIFTVKLTLTDETSLPEPTPMLNTKFPGKRLLFAEDIEINREILLTQLEGTGLIIDIAPNGREALEKITTKTAPYDLVFMDVQMPEMDGLEATRHIRNMSVQGAKELPIVAMTAHVFAEDIAKCLEAGMNDHIGKPVDMQVVFEKLQKYLQ
jgi:signal transduction histidine kinase/ActR/RegA family two-component response regulator